MEIAPNINADCECLPLGRSEIDSKLAKGGLSKQVDDLLRGKENIFAQTPVFVNGGEHKAMLATIEAIESLTKLTSYQDAVLARAELSAPVPDTRGLIFGYDFHLSTDGPKLIEVNTNAGGAFIVSHLLRALGTDFTCCYNDQIYGTKTSPESMDVVLAQMFKKEYVLGDGQGALRTLAILDENPKEQYLYPDMLIAKDLLEAAGINTFIADPSELILKDGELYISGVKIDMIYNRLTDFSLSASQHESVRTAYEAGRVVLSPAPAHHALFADKRNLILFGDKPQLSKWGLAKQHCETLSHVPKTLNLTPKNADEMWALRKKYFFKPRDGFGSRAAYRGSKITKKVWAQISGGTHVAQEYVPPSLRAVKLTDGSVKLKFDLRVYTYNGQVISMAARVYQGQTTNFRTRGGGFAPVILTG